MATTLAKVASMLDAEGVKYGLRDDDIVMGWKTTTYVNPKGDPTLFLVVKLVENGEYFELFAPQAYSVPARRADVFLRACAMIQWKTKLIQFEYDPTDGEIRPIIEFPLEDARLTSRQLMRCIQGMIQIIETYDTVLRGALERGVIDFEDRQDQVLVMLKKAFAEALSEREAVEHA